MQISSSMAVRAISPRTNSPVPRNVFDRTFIFFNSLEFVLFSFFLIFFSFASLITLLRQLRWMDKKLCLVPVDVTGRPKKVLAQSGLVISLWTLSFVSFSYDNSRRAENCEGKRRGKVWKRAWNSNRSFLKDNWRRVTGAKWFSPTKQRSMARERLRRITITITNV